MQDAISRLERAARDISASASDRAAEVIEGVAERLSPQANRRAYRDEAPRWPWSGRPRTARLYRDRDQGKLLGVCAGIANYYGLETWVVRCIALTSLIFLTSVTLVGYVVAAIVMDKAPRRGDEPRRSRPPHRRRSRRDAPEPETVWMPRQRLRDVHADLDQVELRLRRMEAFVTSGHYELHRELRKIEKD